jgi:hypothetical protein
MSEFSPLQKILNQEKPQPEIEPKVRIPPGKRFNDSYVFLLLVILFVLGVSFTNIGNQGITGKIIYEEHSESINLSSLYNESANLSLTLHGNISSFRITGSFIGNGTARIYLGDKIVIDKDLLPEKQANLITGMQVYEEVPIEANNESLSNLTEQNEEIYEPVTAFENYCLETCILNQPGNVTLVIELYDNTRLNLTSIIYTYAVELPEEIAPLENITIENETILNESVLNETGINESIDIILNETGILVNETNITINETLLENITLNETLNESINESLDITQNISVNETTQFENISQNITEINITEIPVALTALDRFNLSLIKKGLKLLDYNSASSVFKVGINENNFVEFSDDSVEDVAVSIEKPEDSRLSSDFVILENLSGSALVKLESENADTILKCVQFTDNLCKRWEKTAIQFEKKDELVSFTVDTPGIYVAADIHNEKKEYVSTNSVYLNSNCDSCEKTYNCRATNVCLINGVGAERKNFIAQVDFDILNLDPVIEKAELCAYAYYNNRQDVITYVKEGPESFCSDIRNANLDSPFISYKLVSSIDTWVCTDVTDMVSHAKDKGYSNIFMNMLGQDLNGESFPFVCYTGITELGNCNNYNPSGSNDCRPYLKLTYK